MGLFRLFQEKKYVRLFLFILLGFILVFFDGCKISYGFPTVYLSYDMNNKSLQNLNILNLLVNIFSMLLIVLFIEKIRTLDKIKNNLIIFDRAIFCVLSYLLFIFILTIVDANYFEFGYSIFFLFPFAVGFFPVRLLDLGGYYNDFQFLKNLYPTLNNLEYRLSVLIFSIALFFAVYYILKFYYKWRNKIVKY